jgi:urease accessory protein
MAHTMVAQATHMVTPKVTITIMHQSSLMSTGLIASMSTELIQLIWLASPALPVGGFSYSEALESAIDHEHVHDEASCADWLADQLHLSQARGDMALMAQAIPAWQALNTERLQALSAWVHATRETHEMRLQTEQMGRSLLDWLRIQNKASAPALSLCSDLRPTYPMAMSLALSLAQAPLEQALQAYAFGWAENMTQAALKAVPLGQVSGQKILARLAHEIPEAVQYAIALNDDNRQAFCPMLAVLSARHETQYSRLFRS